MKLTPITRTKAAVLAVVLASLTLAACSSDDDTSGSPPAATKGASGANVTLLTVAQTCDYCATHTEEIKKVASDAGVNLKVVVNNFDAAEQAQQINQAISTKPDAVIVWPADATAIQPSLARLKAAKIPTIVTNSHPTSTDTSLWTAYTGPNDIANGEYAAKAMIDGFKAKGFDSGKVVVVTGQPGTPPAINRLKGFKDALATDAPGITVVADQPGNWDQTQATTAAATLFTQTGKDLQGVYAQADNMLAGVLTAAKRAGFSNEDLVTVGSNCSIEGYTNIQNGSQTATVLQSPIEDGKLAGETLIKVLNGESVDNEIYMTPKVITRDNLADCAAAVGK